jgi:uncharacterized protein (TIGR02001 family)
MTKVGGRVLSRVSAALLGGVALAAAAGSASAADLSMKDEPSMEAPAGRQLSVTGSVALTTDYVFRGQSQSDQGPAVQGTVEAAYGIFYAGTFASNIDFDDSPPDANLEIDLYGGIRPTWNGVTFDLGIIYYAYPEAKDKGADLDYVEFKAGASGTIFDRLNIGATLYYSPEYTGETGTALTVEGTASASIFKYRGIDFTASGTVGHIDIEDLPDYTYWNLGLTATLKEKYSLDVRYWDTDLQGCGSATVFQCDERVVGTVKIGF